MSATGSTVSRAPRPSGVVGVGVGVGGRASLRLVGVSGSASPIATASCEDDPAPDGASPPAIAGGRRSGSVVVVAGSVVGSSTTAPRPALRGRGLLQSVPCSAVTDATTAVVAGCVAVVELGGSPCRRRCSRGRRLGRARERAGSATCRQGHRRSAAEAPEPSPPQPREEAWPARSRWQRARRQLARCRKARPLDRVDVRGLVRACRCVDRGAAVEHAPRDSREHDSPRRRSTQVRSAQKRAKGIEPSPPAWKAGALPLSYARARAQGSRFPE